MSKFWIELRKRTFLPALLEWRRERHIKRLILQKKAWIFVRLEEERKKLIKAKMDRDPLMVPRLEYGIEILEWILSYATPAE